MRIRIVIYSDSFLFVNFPLLLNVFLYQFNLGTSTDSLKNEHAMMKKKKKKPNQEERPKEILIMKLCFDLFYSNVWNFDYFFPFSGNGGGDK